MVKSTETTVPRSTPGPAYPVARAVAAKVRAHFSRHLALARARDEVALETEPDEAAIEAIIDAAFWASVRHEEGRTPRISLAFLPPDRALHQLMFAEPLPLRPQILAKVAPAVERPGIHLGTSRIGGELRVWGTTREVPAFCLVVEVIASGLLVIKHRSDPFGKFVNVAVLEGDQIKIVDEQQVAEVPDCPEVVKSLLGFNERSNAEHPNILVQLAASMRAHGRGGALLVVPTGTDAWRASVVEPIYYAVSPPFSELADLIRHYPEQNTDHTWQEDLRRAVEAIAGLTAVDGATVMTNRYELLAFGAKIRRRRNSPPVENVIATEPIEDAATSLAPPTQLGGTRHLSAAQFVHDQRDATALVASQDGRFTIFKWSPCEEMVHAHRVDVLLM